MLLKVRNGRPDYIRVTERKRQAAETPEDHREARLKERRAAQQELEIGS